MAKIISAMDVFSFEKANDHFPELHVVYRSDNDCSLFLRTPNGNYYYLTACRVNGDSGVPDLRSSLDGFQDLVMWFYSSQEEFDSIHGRLTR